MKKKKFGVVWVLLSCVFLAGTPIQEQVDQKGRPLQNSIKWSTASELENFGFNVYRSESEQGPFVQINTKPIAGAGTSDEPHDYEFVDDQIEEGVIYFYYIESISMSGQKERFSPTIKSKPKKRENIH